VKLTRRAAFGASASSLVLASSAAAAGPSDVTILGELLRLERRLAALYDVALKHTLLPPALARHLRDQERTHARGLERALADLGAQPPVGATPLPEIPGPRGFAAVALRLEDEAVAAYVDAIAGLRRPGMLQPLGSIAASEGQHQVILRRLAGDDPLR
jgi:hypothetical protein